MAMHPVVEDLSTDLGEVLLPCNQLYFGHALDNAREHGGDF